MMRSLYSGVAGLRTHQTKMDVLGNNIANVNTTSYKSQSITFSDLMYQTTQTASGASETKGGVNARQIGLGAKSGAISTAIESQGATQTTNNPFDIMITGSSFFVVNNGKENLYTRDGSFYVDGAGNLAMQSNGYFVQGWAAKEDKKTGEIQVDKNGDLTSLQIMSADNATYSPASTTQGLYSGNIDDHDTNVTSDDGKTITLEFYDNKGYLYTGKFSLKDTGTDHLFSLELTDIIDSDGNSINKDLNAEGTDKVLDHVTFGEIQKSGYSDFINKHKLVVDSADPKKGTIYKIAGSDVFTDYTINKTGQDLSKLSEIPNFLSQVYKLTDLSDYSIINEYTIDEEKLTINFDYKDVNGQAITNTTYTRYYDNSENETYFYNTSTNIGYLAPPASGTKLSQIGETTLKEVFGIDATKYPQLMNHYSSNAFGFTFDGDDLVITAADEVLPGVTTGYEKGTQLGQKYNDYFVDEAMSGKTVSQVYAENALNYDSVAYTYGTNGKLEMFGVTNGGSEAATPNVTESETTSALFTKLKGLLEDKQGSIDYDNLTDAQKDDVNALFTAMQTSGTIPTGEVRSDYAISYRINDNKLSVFFAKGTDEYYRQLSAADESTYADLTSYLKVASKRTLNYSDLSATEKERLDKILEAKGTADSKNYTNPDTITFSLKSLTGTEGFSIDVTCTDTTAPVYTPVATFDKLVVTKKVDSSLASGQPVGAFVKSANDKAGYVIFDSNDDKKITLDEVPEAVLKAMYGDNFTYDGIKTMNPPRDFSSVETSKFVVTVSSPNGKLTIVHEQPDEYPIDSNFYECTIKDGVATYKTANDTIVYPGDYATTGVKTFDLTGDLEDVLSTSNTNLKAMLKEVFGITDDDARAYGTTGRYTIDPDKGVMLATGNSDEKAAGNKTVQLLFDAANGSLVNANGNSNGLVNIVFDQTTPGLEAFGYQKQNTDGADAILGRLTLDFSTVTNYNTSGSSTVKAVKGDKKSLNTGRAVGEMNGVNISTDGRIYATYSNGQTKLLGQIASAQFANASGLSKEGDNLYSSTLNSGEATIQDITTDGGYMNTGVLEMSNVDLSREFTEMITTQRGFQANSRIITVSDTLLEELTNLKR